jgi:proteasome activator subunit 4
MHLSDQLFDLVLSLVFNYATTNAKSNAVRAVGQLVSSLARVNPERTVAKFLPFCIPQIEDELKHGASSVRTTSTHAAVPSDTTLHWSKISYRDATTLFLLCARYLDPAWVSWIWRPHRES